MNPEVIYICDNEVSDLHWFSSLPDMKRLLQSNMPEPDGYEKLKEFLAEAEHKMERVTNYIIPHDKRFALY